MTWFKKGEEEGKERRDELKPSDQLWTKCNSCNELIYRKVIERNLQVCPKCNYHFQIPARRRIESVADPGSFVEYDANLISTDPLEFKDSKGRYPSRVKESQEKTGHKDAIICGEARIEGQPAMIGIFEFNFMGGSLGSVVGGEDRPFDRTGHREKGQCDHLLCLRGSQDAGRDPLFDADGENQRGLGEAP